MKGNAHRHQLSEEGIVGELHISEDLAGVLVDMDGPVGRGVGAVIAHRVLAQRPHALPVRRRGNLEAALEAQRTCEHPLDIAVQDGGPLSKAEGRNRCRRGGADAR